MQTAYRIREDDSRVKVIHTDNHGSYMARTTGMKAARADYITAIDADDRYFPGCLGMLADLLEECDADVAMGNLVETDCYDAKPLLDEPVITVSTSEQMWPRIMKWKTQEFVCYINKLYKREILPDFVDADGICQGDDVLIACQTFLNVKKIVETTAPVYLYYMNPESLTHAGFGDRDLDVIRVWDKVVQIIRKKRPDLLFMARFSRWRTDFTMISRLILADDNMLDKKYSGELKKWRSG
jgi:glycosyltransferase involved in cell wall biosynthesis